MSRFTYAEDGEPPPQAPWPEPSEPAPLTDEDRAEMRRIAQSGGEAERERTVRMAEPLG